MTPLRRQLSIRLWAFIALLAFAGQLVGASAHAARMINTATDTAAITPHCHGNQSDSVKNDGNIDSSNVASLSSDKSIESKNSCCDADCSMLWCHAVSAMISPPNYLHVTKVSTLNDFFTTSSPLKRGTSLYRPPHFSPITA